MQAVPSSVSEESRNSDSERDLIGAVLEHAPVQRFAAGDAIVTPGADARIFYYVRDGSVEVSYLDSDETRITVALIGTGEFFGEIGFFDAESRVRDIQASTSAEIAVFDREVMETLRVENPGLYMEFIIYLTRRICAKFRRIAGEREPLAAYAESLSTRRTVRYSETRPIPSSLLRSTAWFDVSTSVEAFKSELFDLSHQIQQNEARDERDERLERRVFRVLEALNDALPGFAETMAGSGYEDVMWGYIFKEIFPYINRSRFVERAYYKPKGYAGDFLMMEHIYANVAKGDGRFGVLIDAYSLQRPGSLAIRGRRKLLAEQLARHSAPIAGRGERVNIMNLACGPNRELFDFLAHCDYSEAIEALCVDIDSEALQYTNQHVNIFPHRASVRLMSENVIKWALGRVSHQIEKQDIIYSAGLCDYLDVRLFRALIKRCYEHLKPGGVLLLGNFSPYPDSIFLDKLLRWELLYRTADDLREIFAPTPFGDNITILAEDEKVNLFAMATRD